MQKKFKPILILLAVLALLCILLATVAIVNSIPGEEEETSSTDDTQTTLMTVDAASVYYFKYTHDNNGDGEDEPLEFTLAPDNETWFWEENTSVKLKAGIISEFAANMNSIPITQTFKNVSDEQLSKYGFDEPTKSVTVRDRVKGEQSITFGAYNSYNNCYYVYLNSEKTTVYMISKDIYTGLETSVESFVYLDSFPEIDEEGLVSLVYTEGERKVVCRFVQPKASNTVDGLWERSVDGGEFVPVPTELSRSLTEYVTGMEYLRCTTVYADKLPDYGFEVKDDGVIGKAEVTVNYRVLERIWDEEEQKVVKVWNDETFTVRLGELNEYKYYYANPVGTEIVTMLGGAAYHKVFTYTDAELQAEK